MFAGALTKLVPPRLRDKVLVQKTAQLMYELSVRYPDISGLPARCPLRMRVRKSAIGSVMLMCCSSTRPYQLALRRPGMSPRIVASRSLVRARPNLR